jgi:hypothetical protein
MVSLELPPGIRFNDCLFSEPAPLASFTPPQFAGLYAVLQRDSNWAPKAYQPLYFGEFGNRTPAPAFFRECADLLKSGERCLFVAVLPMPFSTTSQRWTVCHELIRAYHPVCQSVDAFPPGNPMIAEAPAPRPRRIGFMPQTETA